MHQHPCYLTMAQNLSSLEGNVFGEVLEKEFGDNKQSKTNSAAEISSKVNVVAPQQWLKNTTKVLERFVQGAKRVTRN